MNRWLLGILPQLTFVVALAMGVAMTLTVYRAEELRAEAEFDRAAQEAVDLIIARLQQHVVVLRATEGLFAAQNGVVTRDAFMRFLEAVDIERDLSGVQGVGFARLSVAGDDAPIAQEIAAQYGVHVTAHPETSQPWRASIVLLEPANVRNMAALGYDMYSEPVRRAAMDRAVAISQPQMSGPVELVQEIDGAKQTGFLIYLPYVGSPGQQGGTSGALPAEGFVYAPFRGNDLISAVLSEVPNLPVALSITDAEIPDRPLYTDSLPDAGRDRQKTLTEEVLGRRWVFQIHQAGAAMWPRHIGSFLTGLISFLFVAATAFAIVARRDEAAQEREVAAAAAREAEYRGLLLQEMKHRIKNHIARIQSIARQSARGAVDVKAFTSAFDARLQSMAAVQEILAGTAAPQADLREILRKELQQCLDTAEVEHLMEGPPLPLEERQAHAFALVAHELVTNALKYGGLSAGGNGLRIVWRVEPEMPGVQPETTPEVVIDWRESFAPASDAGKPAAGAGDARGFGSRLIDASLKGELSGRIDRDMTEKGLHITLRFPLKDALRTPQGSGPGSKSDRRQQKLDNPAGKQSGK